MSKIFVIMGKSASGKDTIFKKLLDNKEMNLKVIIPYTTRPIREGEKDGVEYFFVDDDKLNELKKQNKIIEHRSYQTVHGVWHYFTANDDQIKLNIENYLMISTLEAYLQIREYYGKEYVLPIYIEIDDGIRLERALNREKLQKEPKYAEMCRRFLADEEDFGNNKLQVAGITKKFSNINMNECLNQIIEYMRYNM